MKKTVLLIYGIAAYVMFWAVALYAIGFIGNFGVSRTLDGLPDVPFITAALINLGLLSAFALQHSGMARQGFKKWLTRWIPAAAERSTYVLISNLAMIALFLLWEPMGVVFWSFDSGFAQASVITLYMFGWALIVVSTLQINHLHLFGVQQVWAAFRGHEIPASEFVTPALYRWVRHPLYVGWLIVFWAAPTMTVSHLFFALLLTVYILVAIRLEERDLEAEFGYKYRSYQRSVPMIIPHFQKQPKQYRDHGKEVQP